jgi:hypothetical protein
LSGLGPATHEFVVPSEEVLGGRPSPAMTQESQSLRYPV